MEGCTAGRLIIDSCFLRKILNWQLGDRVWDLSRQGAVMGILNVTPDSFSDGGDFSDPEVASRHGLRMIEEGAEIIDIGGESTRPGSIPVSLGEEVRRVLPVLKLLRRKTGAILSVDTSKSEVARRALEEGADIINDVTALRGDLKMAEVLSSSRCGVVLMHMKGTPEMMQKDPVYSDVVGEVGSFLEERLHAAAESGISPERIALDPGIGFGKTREHNCLLLHNVGQFAFLGRPLLIGVSRKSYLAAATGCGSMEDRLWPCIALTSQCRSSGARIFRVHDILPNLHALRMTEALLGSS